MQRLTVYVYRGGLHSAISAEASGCRFEHCLLSPSVAAAAIGHTAGWHENLARSNRHGSCGSMGTAQVTRVGIAVWNEGKVVYLKTYGDRNTEPAPASDPRFGDDCCVTDQASVRRYGDAIGS